MRDGPDDLVESLYFLLEHLDLTLVLLLTFHDLVALVLLELVQLGLVLLVLLLHLLFEFDDGGVLLLVGAFVLGGDLRVVVFVLLQAQLQFFVFVLESVQAVTQVGLFGFVVFFRLD